MSKNEDVKNDRDPLDPPQVPAEIPAGLDRRKFIMRGAVISAAAVMTGCSTAETEKKGPPPAARIRRTGGQRLLRPVRLPSRCLPTCTW